MAGVHQRPEQSNFLAEGQILTCSFKDVILHQLSNAAFEQLPTRDDFSWHNTNFSKLALIWQAQPCNLPTNPHGKWICWQGAKQLHTNGGKFLVHVAWS